MNKKYLLGVLAFGGVFVVGLLLGRVEKKPIAPCGKTQDDSDEEITSVGMKQADEDMSALSALMAQKIEFRK